MDRQGLERRVGEASAERLRERDEQDRLQAQRPARESRVHTCRGGALVLMDDLRQFLVDSSPAGITPPSEAERDTPRGHGRMLALNEPVNIVVNLGPPSNPATLGGFNSVDGNMYARVIAFGARSVPGSADSRIERGRATYGSLRSIDTVCVSTFVRYSGEHGLLYEEPLLDPEEYSYEGIVGDEPAANIASDDETLAAYEASVRQWVMQGRDTLTMLHGSARDPALNPQLAARLSGTAAMPDAV